MDKDEQALFDTILARLMADPEELSQGTSTSEVSISEDPDILLPEEAGEIIDIEVNLLT